jgi:hypothetical protein
MSGQKLLLSVYPHKNNHFQITTDTINSARQIKQYRLNCTGKVQGSNPDRITDYLDVLRGFP